MTTIPISAPFLSCIVTTYNEGPLASITIHSILSQSFNDFELLIVDDGASEETRAAIHAFDDPRIKHIRQSNDGLSSARNRALHVARGDYVCFLDADDTRPAWAFAEMVRLAQETEADCIFLPGMLTELRQEVLPFYDHLLFEQMRKNEFHKMNSTSPRFIEALRLLAALEPQAANKIVKRSFVEKHRLRFPSGLFFEDLIFHNGVLMNLESFAIGSLPCFTYFRRYGRPQITASTNTVRFDAVSAAANLLALFERSRYFQDVVMRHVVVAATFKLLKWCEGCISHHYKWAFRQAEMALIAGLDPRYRLGGAPWLRVEAEQAAPWVKQALDHFEELNKWS